MTLPTKKHTFPPDRRHLLSRLMSSGAWAAVGRSVSLSSLLLVAGILARAFTKEEFGLYILQAALVTICAIVALFGLPNTVIRLLRESITAGNHAETISIIKKALLLQVLLSAIVALLYAIGVHVSWFLDTRLVSVAIWALAWIVLLSWGQMVAEILRGLDEFQWSGMMGGQNGGAASSLIFLVFVALASMYYKLTLETVMGYHVAASALPLIIGLVTLARRIKQLQSSQSIDHVSSALRSGATTSCSLLRSAFPILLVQLSAIGVLYFDLIVLALFRSEREVALLGAVKRLVVFIGAPLMLCNIALPPFVAELYAAGQLPRLEKLLRSTATLAAIPALAMLLGVLVFPTQVLHLVFGVGYGDASILLVILSLATVVFVLTGSGGLTLIMTGHQRVAMYVTLATGACYMLALIVLVALWGALGAAMAGGVLIVVQNVWLTWLVRARVHIWPCVWLYPRLSLGDLRTHLKNGFGRL